MASISVDQSSNPGAPRVDASLETGGNFRQVVTIGDPSVTLGLATVDPVLGLNVNQKGLVSNTQCVSVVGAAGAALTASLPPVPSQFHYVGYIEIVKFAAVATVASGTPITVSTTNLPGGLAFTIDAGAMALGAKLTQLVTMFNPLKSSIANTATTIVCPATTNVGWRINVFYYTQI